MKEGKREGWKEGRREGRKKKMKEGKGEEKGNKFFTNKHFPQIISTISAATNRISPNNVDTVYITKNRSTNFVN